MTRSMKAVSYPERRRKPIGAGPTPPGILREGPPPPRLPDESDAHYAWFLRYWREGACASLRSLAARVGAHWTTFIRARRVHSWDARIQAAIEEPPEIRLAWVARREQLREAEWKLSGECLEAGRESLQKWHESGKIPPLGDLLKLLEFSARLARQAAGMPDNHTMLAGEDAEPIRAQFAAALAQAYGSAVDVVPVV